MGGKSSSDRNADFIPINHIFIASMPEIKKPKTVAAQSEISNLRRLQLKLQFVSNQGNKFRIRGFSLGIADGIAEKSLQSVQVTSVPSHFDGVPDGSLHSGRCGLEGLCHLGVEHLGDGVDHVHIVDGDDSSACLWRSCSRVY